MASSGYDVSTSFVILIPREPSARRRKRASAQQKEEARARASSCWSWVWGEEQRQADDDGQLEMNDFAVLKADPGQVFWPAQVTTDNTASAPPTTDDVMFLGVVPCPDADLIRGVSPQSHDSGNCSNLMEETKTFSSTESLRQLSQQLNGLVSESTSYINGEGLTSSNMKEPEGLDHGIQETLSQKFHGGEEMAAK